MSVVLMMLVFVLFVVFMKLYFKTKPPGAMYLIPSAPQVLQALQGERWAYLYDSCVTAFEAVAGFLVGNAVAFCLGILMFRFEVLENAIYPYGIALKAIPVVAFAPLLVVVFGMNTPSKIVAAALVCFFPLLVTLPAALHGTRPEQVELFHALGASRMQELYTLRLRAAVPEVFAALKTSSSLSVVGAIVGEFQSPSAGLGKPIVYAIARGHGDELVVASLMAAVVGIIWFLTIHFAQVLVVSHRRHTRRGPAAPANPVPRPSSRTSPQPATNTGT